VEPHPLLQRTGRHLTCQLPVPLPLAMTGGEATVPGPDKRLVVRIPPGVQAGSNLKLTGQGLPPTGGGQRGDLLVKIVIELPKGLSPEQRSALEQVLGAIGPVHYPQAARFRAILEDR